jgi:fructosamine-3-kinase
VDSELGKPGPAASSERHPLLGPAVVREVERAAAAHLGRKWRSRGFTDLSDRAAHPAGIYHGRGLSVFAKLAAAPDGQAQFAAELRGLGLLRQRAPVRTPVPVGGGLVAAEAGALILLEALAERPAGRRSAADYQAIGTALAGLHQVHDEQFGLPQFDGYFGPLAQDNRPVRSNRWADFYAERRVAPLLRTAVDAGRLPAELTAGIAGLIRRLPELCGPEPRPSLLHGDAQQNNFVSTPGGAVVIDPCPYFGHPEVDLALLGYFEPVPGAVLAAYCDVAPLDQGYEGRQELWRIFAYLAVIAVDGASPLGRSFLSRLDGAVRRYGP